MIAILDYGAGNLGSVQKALRYVGADVRLTRDADEALRADAMVLPGVGAFGHCLTGLTTAGLADAVKAFIASGKPFLGICVGLQMLFDESEEMGPIPGLGILRGRVVRFRFPEDEHSGRHLKVPHIGWNALSFREDAKLFHGLKQGDRVYFVHSYYPEPEDAAVVSATTEYGVRFCCAVEWGNIHATQFHPEKSGAVGLTILRNFVHLIT